MLEGAGEVEEGLGAGAHRDQRVVGDGVEVGGDVARGVGTAMDAADAPGREHADPGGVGQGERGRHGGGAVLPSHGDRHAQVPLGGLRAGPADAVVLLGVDAHPRDAVQHRRHGRHAPPARTTATHRSSASRLAGEGSPRFEKIVDSSATTGAPAASASATSGVHDGA